MNKKQRKRREKQARNHAQGTLHCETIVEQKGADINHTEKPEGQKHPSKKENKISRFQRFLKLANDNAGAILAVLTAVLVGIGGLQAVIYFNQLKVMQMDERAWVTVDIDHFSLDPGLSATVKIINSGRTVATNVTYDFILSTLHKPQDVEAYMNQLPELPDKGSVSIITPGFPPSMTLVPAMVADDAKQAIRDGSKPLCFFGTIHYFDVSKEGHTTHFCAFYSAVDGGKPADCQSWNSAD